MLFFDAHLLRGMKPYSRKYRCMIINNLDFYFVITLTFVAFIFFTYLYIGYIKSRIPLYLMLFFIIKSAKF